LFLLFLGFYLYTLLGTEPAAPAYAPEDVVQGTPLRAVHGMEAGLAGASGPLEGSGAAAVVHDRFFDFGRIDADRTVERVFPIANNGSEALIIQEAHTTCGCTTADFSAAVIPPGKVALMTLHFDPSFHNFRGQTVRRGVMIHTNDPRSPTVEIWIQATVK
jgi:hypothetical protein